MKLEDVLLATATSLLLGGVLVALSYPLAVAVVVAGALWVALVTLIYPAVERTER